mmetsp:Transcript_8120/g.15305  ORF Transcript_8120/g.15305 Transcript_8120/m.15305 type:complete len:186 (+) Transcript_8120:17-574(+)
MAQGCTLPAIGSARQLQAVADTVTVSSAPGDICRERRGSKARPPKETLLRLLSRERRRRSKAEDEARHLMSQLGTDANISGTLARQRLTKERLRTHEASVLSSPTNAVDGASAAEVLQWKRLVKLSEKRQLLEEAGFQPGAKITEGAYCGSDARHQYQNAAKARKDMVREGYGSLQLGGAAMELA